MNLSIIVAYSKNRVIGKNGAIPWDIPEDRLHFKELTSGNTVIFGRKSFEEIGHALPHRYNIVISNTVKFAGENLVTADSLKTALELAPANTKIFICGGQKLYEEALRLNFTTEIYVTEIDAVIDGDRFFPEVRAERFIIKDKSPVLISGNLKYKFIHYISKKN